MVAHVARVGRAVDAALVLQMRDERLDRVLVLLDPLGERLLAQRLVLRNRLERDPLLTVMPYSLNMPSTDSESCAPRG